MSLPWWKKADSLASELERLMQNVSETLECRDKKALADFLYTHEYTILRIMQEYAKEHDDISK